ncbi:MAG: phosphatidate cytidylyltransferase [Clostridia bacterium]|nr:phosphatidate cytidylyltransferase [Clostridia bacterium]
MKTRVITGLVAAAAALVVLLLLPYWAVNILVAILAAVAVYELANALKLSKNYGVLAWCMLLALSMPFWGFLQTKWIAPILLVFVFGLAAMLLLYHQKVSAASVLALGFLTLFVGFGFTALALLRQSNFGLAYVFFALMAAWMSDTGAYFSGYLFGKHKLCPIISPKKTVEGFVGGILFSILICTVSGIIYGAAADVAVCWWRVALLAGIASPISVMGDLFASVIKRQNDIKDYGNLFPGHGGVMDRFDSVIFVAPLVWVTINWLPLIG